MKPTSRKQLTLAAVLILLAAICAFWVQERRTILQADSAPVAVPSTSVEPTAMLTKEVRPAGGQNGTGDLVPKTHLTSASAEPSAPDVLDLVVQGDGAASGNLTFEAVVKPTLDSAAELEIDDPGGAKFQSGQRTKQFNLRQDGRESRERVQVNVADGKPRTLKVRLRLLGADGKPWMIVERELKVNQPPENAGAQKRVPVVHTLPDGTRIVEYLTSQKAVARGLPAGGKPARSSPAPPTNEKQGK